MPTPTRIQAPWDQARDGTVLPGFVTSDVSSFESNVWSVPCTEAGGEGVCVDRSGLVWLSRDGSYRYSDVLEDIECSNGCDVAYTGTSVALAWTASSSGGKMHLVYARFGMDGSLEIPPVPGYPVGMGPLGVHAVSSGEHVLVAAESSFAPDQSPQVHLLDLDGHTLDVPVPLTDRGLGWHWRGVAVFWEGDAYSALWNTWGGTTVGGTVAYRRFRVE